jgi:hypothetical protein
MFADESAFIGATVSDRSASQLRILIHSYHDLSVSRMRLSHDYFNFPSL